MQPVERDEQGVVRFRANPIVRYLLDQGGRFGLDMNHLAIIPGFTAEDRMHFAQLIGYSVSGFSELRYVDDETYKEAVAASMHLDPEKDPPEV